MKYKCGAGCDLKDDSCYGIAVEIIVAEAGIEFCECSLCEKHLKDFNGHFRD